jgi:hypothetical protein
MLIFFLSFPFCAIASTFSLTEKSLIELAGTTSPKMSEIRAQLLRSMTDKSLLSEKYSPEIYARGSYSETQERPVIQFLPVFSPVKTGFFGVRQKFSKGFEAQMQLASDQRSASSALSGQYRDVTTNILSLTVQMDLWKDLLGTLSEAELERSELSSKRAKIEEDINKKALIFSTRRLFWSLVANAEQMKIANRLLTDAKIQLKDAERRLSKSVSDAGDVARYEALLAQRKGQLIFLIYQRELITKSIKTLIPDLNGKELQVGGHDIERTIEEVKECAAMIVTSPAVPWNFTRYDEVLNYLKDLKNLNKTINQKHSDVDVKLFGTVKSTGVGSDKLDSSSYRGSYGRAFGDMQNNNRSGYEIGVNLTIPLGEAKEETKNIKTLYDEERLHAQIRSYDAQISSTHSELAKSLALIGDVIETQKQSTSALHKRVKVQRQKFDQARVSTSELLLDQEALLNSEISTIDSQLQALNVLIDYLMIFTDTPCAFNRM